MRTPLSHIHKIAALLGGTFLSSIKNVRSLGAYALILKIEKNLKITTGILGKVTVPAGWFLYAGRASRGFSKRLERHRQRQKIVHWHIDYLTTLSQVTIHDILILPENPERECEIIRKCLDYPFVQVPIIRFGSSDCTEGCPAHLVQLK